MWTRVTTVKYINLRSKGQKSSSLETKVQKRVFVHGTLYLRQMTDRFNMSNQDQKITGSFYTYRQSEL